MNATAAKIRHTQTEWQAGLEQRKKLAWKWRKQGYKLREIGEALGVTDATVCYYVKQAERERARPVRPERNLPPLPDMRQQQTQRSA